MDKFNCEQWRTHIINFFMTRISDSGVYKLNDKIIKKSIEIEVEKDSKKIEKKLKEIEKFKSDLEQLILSGEDVIKWLDTNIHKKIDKGQRIIRASHILKISHSSASNDGLLVEQEIDVPLLSTSSIPNHSKIYDMAHNNGNLITISRFLALSLNGISIYDLILNQEFMFIKGFSKNIEQLKKWENDLSDLVEKRGMKSARFTKQSYFPISDKKYQLLSILNSSSLAQSIYIKINNIKYQKKIEDFSTYVRENIPKNKIAVIRVGGNNSQNVSMLNQERKWRPSSDSKTYGVYFTNSCQPPTWNTQIKPPIYKTSFFYKLSNNDQIKEIVGYLSEFLLRFENLDLSIRNPKRMQWVIIWIGEISDEIIAYIKTIQNLPMGWSAVEDIKLKKEHQILLDCYRQDEDFQQMKSSMDWKSIVIKDFANWLNFELRITSKNKEFTPQEEHTKLWIKIFEQNIREILDSTEKMYLENV